MPFQALGLREELLKAVEALGYSRPTPIQERGIPHVLAGRDVVGIAQTGTGKTAAYMLPLLQRMLERAGKGVRVLVLAPTRELAQQIEEDLRGYAKFTRLRGAAVFGGVGFENQKRALKGEADVIVATPGRLLDHMKRGGIRLDQLQALVLDEADRMLDMGFMPDVLDILKRLPKKRQNLLFSATMPPAIYSLAAETLHDPVTVEVARSGTVATGLRHAVYPVDEPYKLNLLVRLLGDPNVRSVIVFVSMRNRAEQVRFGLEIRNLKCAVLHSDRAQRERDKALEDFREGRARVLVATDLAQRGLDVEHVSHVISYDTPRNAEEYVHRSGRTARASAVGDSWVFAKQGDLPTIRSIEHSLGMTFPRITLPDFDYGPLGPPRETGVAAAKPRRRWR